MYGAAVQYIIPGQSTKWAGASYKDELLAGQHTFVPKMKHSSVYFLASICSYDSTNGWIDQLRQVCAVHRAICNSGTERTKWSNGTGVERHQNM